MLMYHRVLDAPEQETVFVQPGMYVRTETFRRHIAFLKNSFSVLSLWEIVSRIREGKSVGRCCAITFDDGWRDSYTRAFPVLKEFGVPATIFLATGFIGTNRLFWPEEFAYYLRLPEIREAARQKSDVLDKTIQRLSGAGEGRILDECISALKVLQAQEREELLAYLRTICQSPPPERLLLNWDEAGQMQESGLVSFGGHTADHVILDRVPKEKAEQEIMQSCRDIKEHLGVRPDLFAYPNGNYNPEIKALLEKHGIRGAVTTKKGWLTKQTDLLEIPRIGMHEDVVRTIPLFLGRIFLKGF
ncbi:peptidoglycan/xylan/chitin deacetylase (PgdA/CDA1 family) [Desulfosalsimonas propionicica]|uniref:Peptidoglycan/xylan/chitin deacetylase (PgdA/CDA1 family) n=2 Tax=Desulfosalsimonas propionicica TaxID=332175 RepID=A0A7W0CC97_9BACT|nr:peptidoglycan/xylan/chitin deacetylase (PgdA/CDA1 family) [Desulfosalsimonas propionicica]